MTIIPREIVQFKQHTFSRVSMVRIFRVLTYMHLHAREIRLFVYQTIKWHLLKQVDLPRSPRRILTKYWDDRDSKNMKNVIKVSVKVLKDYLTEKAGDFSDVSELDEAARPAPVMSCQHWENFMARYARSMDHSMLKKSMVTLRFGLQKHFLKTRKEDIINLEQYQSANEMALFASS